MALPSVTDYHDAVQVPDRAFSDPVLRAGVLATSNLGLPLMLGGGLAVTYQVTVGAKTYAVRCFHREAPDLAERYAKISTALKSLGSNYFVEFDYQPAGVLVRGTRYPIIKMDWVQGQTLDIYVKSNLGNASRLRSLRERFTKLESFLRLNGIAHGDLQNLNVIVQNGELHLIDYDGMFVPGMRPGDGSEIGHKAFQHPKRTTSDFSSSIDRFSFITIDLGLEALSHNPNLFEAFKHGGEAIVFSANDYADPQSSPAFAAVRAIPELAAKADRLAAICGADVRDVPSLEDYLAGNNIPQIASQPVAALTKPQTPIGYIGPYAVFDAGSFETVLGHVGERVELVGQITSVKEGIGLRGRGRGKPYVFINFGAWNHQSVKVTLWSEALEQVTSKPTEAWVGRWISVTGLIEPPYEGSFRGRPYKNVGITISSDGQIVPLTESEAAFRLGAKASAGLSSPKGAKSNQDILRELKGGAGAGRSSAAPSGPRRSQGRTAPSSPPPVQTTNAAILAALKASTPATPPPQTPSSRPTSSAQQQSRSSAYGWVWAAVVLGGIIIALSKCSG